ncbi:MAG TPA: polyprenyl diphosphate synthase [Candidatus Bilamarchaeaceae archaeon]|nr:polyprenyl diphosphate synthase [Candidatus Bilamarchaeaceae archaeon]
MDQPRPKHVVIIPDGNRRWGEQHGISREEAYRIGIEKIADVAKWCREEGVPILTMWGFSTENFQRDPEEIRKLFGLFQRNLIEAVRRKEEKDRYGVRVRFLGRTSLFPSEVQGLFQEVERLTAGKGDYQLNLLLAYGGRAEIVDAVKAVLKEGKEITEESISSHLYTAGIPDPDLVIRTSGEQRLSGLLPWQSAYSELYFSQKLWPDFTRDDFMAALKFYENTGRRFGK